MTELDKLKEYNFLLEVRISELELHCTWLASLIKNWTDDEITKDFDFRRIK